MAANSGVAMETAIVTGIRQAHSLIISILALSNAFW